MPTIQDYSKVVMMIEDRSDDCHLELEQKDRKKLEETELCRVPKDRRCRMEETVTEVINHQIEDHRIPMC